MRSGSRNVKKSNTSEMVKQKLLASIAEHSDGEEDYFELNEKVRNAKQLQDSIALVKKYENILKGTKKKIIKIVGKQSELLKCFRDEDEFFDRIDLSRSNIYFKTSLYKFLHKFPLLKNSIPLLKNYFKSNGKLIEKVCKTNVNIFREEN